MVLTNPPGTLITITAQATCDNAKPATAQVCLVVIKSHKFRYAPSAASILLYKGTYVSYVLNNIRLSGILLANGQVFDGKDPITPERW